MKVPQLKQKFAPNVIYFNQLTHFQFITQKCLNFWLLVINTNTTKCYQYCQCSYMFASIADNNHPPTNVLSGIMEISPKKYGKELYHEIYQKNLYFKWVKRNNI